MPAFRVQLNNTTSCGHTLKEGADAMVVFAADANTAKQIAAARFDGDGLSWSEATVTEITAAADWAGWTFRVAVAGVGEVEFVGAAAATLDTIGAGLATALNALPAIAGAAYNASTNVLTVADATDALGDKAVYASATPPGGFSPIPALIGTITDEGSASAALTVALVADATVIPRAVAVFRQV